LTTSTPLVDVVQGEVRGLQLGAHRAVADHHALGQRVQDVAVVVVFVGGSHATRIVVL